jgi:hypothetical protein
VGYVSQTSKKAGYERVLIDTCLGRVYATEPNPARTERMVQPEDMTWGRGARDELAPGRVCNVIVRRIGGVTGDWKQLRA